MEINRNNYESFLLLYLDGELNGKDRKLVENFLLDHADLQKEFSLLKQTVLVPTAIVFENKEGLYRSEEKRRVIPMFWLRSAAAVAVLILGSWILISQLTKNSSADKPVENQLANAADTRKNPPAENSASRQSVINTDQVKNSQPAEKNTTGSDLLVKAGTGNKTGRNNQTKKAVIVPIINHQQSPVKNKNPQNTEEEETIAAVKKSNTDLAVQTVETAVAKDPGQAVVQPAKALVLTATVKDPVQTEFAVTKNNDNQTDNAISVVALNDPNKGISKFFNKLTKRTAADEKERKVRVSVFQFSY